MSPCRVASERSDLNAAIYLEAGCFSQSSARPQPYRGKHDVSLYDVAVGESNAEALMDTLHALGCCTQVKNHARRFQPALHIGPSVWGGEAVPTVGR